MEIQTVTGSFLLRTMSTGRVPCMVISVKSSNPLFSIYMRFPSAGIKGVAWAYEPEITAMGYLLNTTLAVFSRTANRKGNHWQFYRPGPGHPLSDPMLFIVNLHRFHFEPVQYYNLP